MEEDKIKNIVKGKRKENDKRYREKHKKEIREHKKQYYQQNKEKIKEVSKDNYQKNKEKRKKYAKEYYEKNKREVLEKQKEGSKKYRKENQEKERNRHKIYYQNNKEKVRIYGKKYREKNQEKIKGQKNRYREKNKERIKEKDKEYYQRPEVKARQKEYYKNPEVLKKQYKAYIKRENERRKKLNLPLVGQRFLREMEMFVYLNKLFSAEEIVFHDRKTLNGLELDAFLPGLKLAFEYMGRQHFEEHYVNSIFIMTKEKFEAQKFRDQRKIELCKEKGIILIHINYNEKLSEQLILLKLNEKGISCVQKRLK